MIIIQRIWRDYICCFSCPVETAMTVVYGKKLQGQVVCACCSTITGHLDTPLSPSEAIKEEVIVTKDGMKDGHSFRA